MWIKFQFYITYINIQNTLIVNKMLEGYEFEDFHAYEYSWHP